MKPRSGRLAMIAAFLALAASLKLVEGLGSARAQMPSPGAAAEEVPAALEAADGQMPEPAAPHGRGTRERLDAELIIELRQRELRLGERENALATRQQELRALEQRLAAQIEALEAAETALAGTMALADQAAEADLARLTSMFEAMRPEQAAAVVSEMAPEFAAGLLGRLQPTTAAMIMAGLDPGFAYGLAAILAGRNAEVPRRAAP